jgi:hypothetical protein
MRTGQEFMSTGVHVLTGLKKMFSKLFGVGLSAMAQSIGQMNLLAGIANSSIGKSKGVKCPSCGVLGRWEDCK